MFLHAVLSQPEEAAWFSPPHPQDTWLLCGLDFSPSCLGISQVDQAPSLTCPRPKEAASLSLGLGLPHSQVAGGP